jgi:hypothetical protein
VKKLLLATVVGMLAVTAPLSAHADGPGYTGNCRISTVNDTTPDGTLGGQRVWNGQVNIEVAASTPGALVSASCYIRVGAAGTESKILDATVIGAEVGVGAGQATFTADVTDTVYICTHVTTTSNGAQDQCAALTTTPICPEAVCAPGGILDQVIAILNGINDQTKVLDQVICPVLISAASTVDGLPTSGVLWIDPVTGDTYVGGDHSDPANLFWDCPPYVVTP